MKKMLLLLMLIYMLSGTVSASGVVGEDEECIIYIDTTENGLEGEIIEIYKVGRIDEQSNNLIFILTEEFAQTNADLNNYEKKKGRDRSELCDILLQACKEATPIMRMPLDAEGEANFEVEPGMYLICSMTKRVAEIQPVLVSVPNMNAEMDGWEYSVKVEPKVLRIENPDAPATGDVSLSEIIWLGIVLVSMSAIFVIVMIVRIKEQKRR